MLQRLMNKKVVIGLLGILILLAAFGRIMTTPAEEYRFVTWEKGTSENEVKVSVMLSAREDVQKAGTFQVQFGVASDDPDGIEDIKFKFDSDLKNNSDVTVKTYRYNQSNGTLTIYVSGVADDILKKGTALNLGTIVVNADSDVTFSVEPGGCKTADENYTERTLTVFGSQDDYTVKRETSDDETPNETPEETTPDETPEETQVKRRLLRHRKRRCLMKHRAERFRKKQRTAANRKKRRSRKIPQTVCGRIRKRRAEPGRQRTESGALKRKTGPMRRASGSKSAESGTGSVLTAG